jgi:Zn-dependent M32 family carboxypeptidase
MNYQKYANTYKNGEIISKKDENGITRDYTIQEVEELIDKLSEDKDENGKVKDPESLNNAVAILMQLYRKYGNPHEKDIIEAIKKAQEEKPLEEQKKEALEEVKEQLSDNEIEPKDASTMYNEEYVDFEEVK